MKISNKAYSVYAVTDRSWLDGRTLAHDVEEVLKGGATLLQLREKKLGFDEFLAEALEIKAICHRYGVPFIINDNIEVALACGADGVHIGQDDMPLSQARQILGPDVCIGVSAQTVAQAIAAEKGGADCIGVGAVFPTGTKTDAVDVPFNELAAICQSVNIPVVAIGGISSENVSALAGSGIAGVAAVSAFFKGGDPMASTQKMAGLINSMLAENTAIRDGAIVDMDGTLLDTLSYWDTLAENFLSEFGISVDRTLRKTIEDMEMWQVAAYLKQKFDLKMTEQEITSALYERIGRIYRETAPLKPGAFELVRGLYDKGVKIAVFTATKGALVEAALRRTGLLPYIDLLLSSSDLSLEKKDPTAFYYVLGKLGTGLKNTVVYDDAPFAINAAQKAGFKVVGFFEKYWDYSDCYPDEWIKNS